MKKRTLAHSVFWSDWASPGFSLKKEIPEHAVYVEDSLGRGRISVYDDVKICMRSLQAKVVAYNLNFELDLLK